MLKKHELIELTHLNIKQAEFINRHKGSVKDFTRERIFTFLMWSTNLIHTS